MQNIYPASWLYLTGHCYVRSIFAKHHFVPLVVCLFFDAVFYCYHYYYIVIIIIIIIIIIIYLFYKN